MNKLTVGVLACVWLLASAAPARAQTCGDPPDVLIVLDRSSTMNDSCGTQSKWEVAKTVILDVVKAFQARIRFGINLFPAVGGDSPCAIGTMTPNVEVTGNAYSAVAALLGEPSSEPYGNTPLGYTLRRAGIYLEGIDPGKTKYVLVISDGQENCAAVPEDEVSTLRSQGIRTYVVGFGAEVDPLQLSAMATAGDTNRYFQADLPTELKAALESIASQVSCCGNGALDPGEVCDTAIASGRPGACPTGCDDGDPCTADAPSGQACGETCTHTAITALKSGDGCCPTGATLDGDADCGAICSNGLLESGETCDPGITAGQGTCPSEADCSDGEACTLDTVVGDECHKRCEHAPLGAKLDGKDGCCPAGLSAREDADCLPLCDPDTRTGCIPIWSSNASATAPAGDSASGDSASGGSASGDSAPPVEGGLSCQTGTGGPGASWPLLFPALLALFCRRRDRPLAGAKPARL